MCYYTIEIKSWNGSFGYDATVFLKILKKEKKTENSPKCFQDSKWIRFQIHQKLILNGISLLWSNLFGAIEWFIPLDEKNVNMRLSYKELMASLIQNDRKLKVYIKKLVLNVWFALRDSLC